MYSKMPTEFFCQALDGQLIDVTVHAVSISVIAGGYKENEWKWEPSG